MPSAVFGNAERRFDQPQMESAALVTVLDEVHYAFDFQPSYAVAARPFRVTPRTASITVSATRLYARFGPWKIDTALANIASVALTGPYAFIKTAGPARLGLTDRGLTFATKSHGGVCIEFVEPITGIDPWGKIRHPNLTLTPIDRVGLFRALGGTTPK